MLFRFQTGAIKSEMLIYANKHGNRFRFQTGAIKRSISVDVEAGEI